MATNPQLRADLLKKLDVTPQRLSQLVQKIKSTHGPMTTEEGAYVVAHQKGLDLTRYLEPALVDRIREMVPRSGGQVAQIAAPQAKARRHATKPLVIAPRAGAIDPLLPPRVVDDASRMAQFYVKLYIFENSVRNLITRVLAARHGKNWWADRAPVDVRNTVHRRKDDEDKKPWHGTRGSHEIYYADFGDLRKLIISNWSDFQTIFPDQPWVTHRLEGLEPARNVLAHNNPVATNEEKRIDLYLDDWLALLKVRRDLVP